MSENICFLCGKPPDELKRLNDFLDWLKSQSDPATVQNVKEILAKLALVLGKLA